MKITKQQFGIISAELALIAKERAETLIKMPTLRFAVDSYLKGHLLGLVKGFAVAWNLSFDQTCAMAGVICHNLGLPNTCHDWAELKADYQVTD